MRLLLYVRGIENGMVIPYWILGVAIVAERLRGLEMKTMKKNRLRMLVRQGSITQPQANQMWRDYLRNVIPVGKIPKIGG